MDLHHLPNMMTNDWLRYFADITSKAVEAGRREEFCNKLEADQHANVKTVALDIISFAKRYGPDPKDYDRQYPQKVEID